MRPLNIATWNVNSINQRASAVVDLIEERQIDVLLLQELKCQKEKFPFSLFEDLSWCVFASCQKAYNGVAVASRFPLELVSDHLMDEEARYIETLLSIEGRKIRFISVYVPNAQSAHSPRFEYKMRFHDVLDERIANCLQNHDEILVMGGDMNVAPEDIDVYDPDKLDGCTGFHIEERARMRKIINLGLFDAFRVANPELKEFSWWDYRGGGFQKNHGMRIDHILLSAKGMDSLVRCDILKQYRTMTKPSDHVPVLCTL